MIMSISISPTVNPIQIPFDPIKLYNTNIETKGITNVYKTDMNVENADLSIAS